MLTIEVQWIIIFGIIAFLVFLYLILDWFVIDNYLDKKDAKNRSKSNID